MSQLVNFQKRLFILERKVDKMSQELEEVRASVALIHKAVGEGVEEIRALAEQLALIANRPNPEAAEFQAIAADLRSAAETLHSAVYPPSSHVPLEP